jgi:lipopolysaccharide biosynthesis glycosyltransferase
MVDVPYPKKYDTKEFSHMKPYPCMTSQEVCEDCRETNIDDIVSIHLTNCQKPWHCCHLSKLPLLCVQHWHEWYRMRYLFEAKMRQDPISTPRMYVDRTMGIQNISFGYCSGYGPLKYHSINESMITLYQG